MNERVREFLSLPALATAGKGRAGCAIDLLTDLYVFILRLLSDLAIRRVSPLLHTPLMSLTNALDAIAVVGAIILAGEGKSTLATILGRSPSSQRDRGFLITDRMLKIVEDSAVPRNHELLRRS